MKEVVVLQHVPNEGAGTLRDYMEKKSIPYRMIGLYKGDAIPRAENVRAALIMGGPMNVYEEAKFPFLIEENKFVKELIDRDIPTLGVCLGSQLIAKALGSKVYKAAKPEVGWDWVRLEGGAKEDPLFSSLEEPRLRVLQWHEDTFDLPAGSAHLASSAVVPNQAYRVKQNIYGFQFHVEVDRPMVIDWFKDRVDREEIAGEFDAYKARLSKVTEGLYECFFKLCSVKEGA